MHPDDDLRSRLDRLVASPDAQHGWEEHRVRTRRAQRRRERVLAGLGAIVIAIVIVGVAVALGNDPGKQKLNVANPGSISMPHGPTSIPDSGVNSGTTIVGQTTLPGETPGTSGQNPDRPGSGPGGGSSGGSGSGPTGTAPSGTVVTAPGGGAATTVPGGTSGGSGGGTTEPGSTESTTTTSPADASIDVVEAGIRDILDGHDSVVRDIGRATLAGDPVVSVHLRADGQGLADQIQTAWPDRTVIYLGFFPYGPGTSPSSPCGSESVPATAPTLPFGLTGSIGTTTVASGADFLGTVTITNKGPQIVTFTHGSHTTVRLYKASGGAPVGCTDAPVASQDVFDSIAPGTSQAVTINGGTASTDRKLFAVPAGSYVGVIHFQVNDGSRDLTYRFPITVT